jgi:NAD(P)-dependent dehydrogenase (short-subunit alcohol dehydrogenase family)
VNLNLQGRHALVTGSTSGIGFAIARDLAREGAAVVVNGRTAENVARASGRILAEVPGATVEGIVADAGTAAGVDVLALREGPWTSSSATSVSTSRSPSSRSRTRTGSACSR